MESSTSAPVVLVQEAAEQDEGPIGSESMVGRTSVDVADSTFWTAVECVDQVSELAGSFCDLPDAVELFGRIRDAIHEAHSQIARQKPSEAA